MTTLGTYFSSILPADWPYSAMVLSSSLLSGLLFMAVLVFIDPVTHGWMVDSLRPSSERRRRRHHRHSPVTCSEATTLEQQQQHPADPPKMGIYLSIYVTRINPSIQDLFSFTIEEEENRYRMSQIYDPAGGKFPLTNGSLFVHLMNPSGGTTSSSESRTTIEGIIVALLFFFYDPLYVLVFYIKEKPIIDAHPEWVFRPTIAIISSVTRHHRCRKE